MSAAMTPPPSPLADRPALLDALRRPDGSRPHAVIEASAGTGKTHTLEHLVVDLLREGTPIERILVVTFTEKATLEMRARIRERIAKLVASAALPARETEALRVALLDFDRAPISTIHAFCQRVLAEQAFATGRLLEQQRWDPREAFARSFRDALRRGLAAEAPERPLLEQAILSMGAAKLEETLWRWSLERGEVRPRFDADAVVEAVRALPDPSELEGTVGRALLATASHHAVRNRAREVLAAIAPVVSRARAGEPIDLWLPELLAWASDAPSPRADSNVAYLGTHFGAHPELGPHVRALATHASSALPVLIGRVLPKVVERLEAEKRERGRFDFDDMLRLVHEALHGPRGDEVTAALRARYRYALVDEFQDTDPVQWAIFRRVFFDRDDGGALVVIGDPKQSIYAFRSADVHTYLAACEEIVAAGGVKVPLVDCYRSTQAMIDAVNLVLAERFFTGPNRYEHPVRCGRPQLRAVELEDGVERPVAPITLLHLHADDELRAEALRLALASTIAEEIERLVGGGMWVTDRSKDDGSLRPVAPSDVFVLTRTGKEAQEVADALRRRGIPHALSSQDGLFDTREARDVLDVLRALEDPGSRALRMRAFMTPFFGVMQDELDACRHLPGDHPFAERLARWAQLARDHRFAALFQAMLDESGLARRLLFLREGERELVNYQHVLEILLARASQGRLALREITTELSGLVNEGRKVAGDDEDMQRLESERAAVQLLTMHKSKGLEAEVVFLFGGMSQRPASPHEPHVFHDDGRRIAWIGNPGGELGARVAEEERHEHERLLYVALTRARSRIYLPYVGPAPLGQDLPAGQASSFPRLSGAYRVLADRLVSLAETGGASDPALFARKLVKVTASRRRIAIPAPLPEIDPAAATAPAVEIPPLEPPDRFERLRAAARGVEVTSYTRMKAGRARLGHATTADDEAAWIEELATDATVAVAPAETDDPLPAGAAFGVFVHELLEKVDAAKVRETSDPNVLLEDARTRELFERSAERNGIDPRVLPRVAELVLRALRTPIRAGDLLLPSGFVSLEQRVAEMSFLYPIPERGHPELGRVELGGGVGLDAPPLAIERGFVRGVIDLLFEHGGRTYVLDWKTDRMPVYDAATLEAHVAAHYEIQARLYALGVARMLRIESAADHERRFGGIVYCFVRGLKERSRGTTVGITFARPSWETLIEWDRTLREQDSPWGHPLPSRPAPNLEERA